MILAVDTSRRSSVVADLRLRHGGDEAGVYRPMLSTYPGSSQAIGTPSVIDCAIARSLGTSTSGSFPRIVVTSSVVIPMRESARFNSTEIRFLS